MASLPSASRRPRSPRWAKVASNAALAAAVKSALAATEDYRRWVEQQAATKTGPSGVGVATTTGTSRTSRSSPTPTPSS